VKAVKQIVAPIILAIIKMMTFDVIALSPFGTIPGAVKAALQRPTWRAGALSQIRGQRH
jgi:hypothetical protein